MWERRVLTGLAVATGVVLSASGCASWTFAPSEIDRAGQKVHTQVQVMRLVADAALRDWSPTNPLRVMVDDAGTALSEEEEKIRGLGGADERSRTLLDLVDRAQDELASLRSSIDGDDPAGLRQVRRDLAPVADRLAELGLS